jgi:uncharacterized protein (TIGR02757 family)
MTTTIDNKNQTIRNILEKLYRKYNHQNLIKPDPLQFIYNYTDKRDMEIAGLLSASLAYGRVEQIQNSLTKLLGIIGKSPYVFVLDFNQNKRNKLRDFKHRFNTGDDISDLLELLKIILKKHDCIEEYFLQGFDKSDENIIPALSKFCDTLIKIHSLKHDGKINHNLEYLLVSPSRGSVCKRMNLFLRWMIRNDEVDSGLWKNIDKAKLIVPIDVHMGRLCGFLGFHNKKNISLKTAIEITKHFAEIEPSDPVKYDFSLSRIGIVENCTGKYNAACQFCELNDFCKLR